ncbi:hypothetical protein ACKU3Z_029510 [Pseudomonas aeruginosa]|nr:hypothetical protein [Pseudomonas aeruginosa]
MFYSLVEGRGGPLLLIALGSLAAAFGLVGVRLILAYATAIDPEQNAIAIALDGNLAGLARMVSYASVPLFSIAGFLSPIRKRQQGYLLLSCLGATLCLFALALFGYAGAMYTIDSTSQVMGALLVIGALATAFVGGLTWNAGMSDEVETCRSFCPCCEGVHRQTPKGRVGGTQSNGSDVDFTTWCCSGCGLSWTGELFDPEKP